MSRFRLILGRQVPGNKHLVHKDTLNSSAGDFSIKACVVSHKSYCFIWGSWSPSRVISRAWHNWAVVYVRVLGSVLLRGLRTTYGCHWQPPPSPWSLFAASLFLFIHVNQCDFYRYDFYVLCKLLYYCHYYYVQKCPNKALGRTCLHTQSQESFRLLCNSEAGRRLSAVTCRKSLLVSLHFFPHVHPWAASSPCLLPTPSP